MNELRAVIVAGGVTVYDATPALNTGSWSSASSGGYASCELTLPGIRVHQIPYLALLRLTYGTEILFEGQIEDRGITIDDSGAATTIQAFGHRRRLAETSLQRVWVKRDLTYQEPATIGTAGTLAAAGNALSYHPADWNIVTGQIDPANLTRIGLLFDGSNSDHNRVASTATIYTLPAAGLVTRILFDATTNATANDVAGLRESADGSAWTEIWSAKNTAKTSYTQPVAATTRFLQFIGHFDTGLNDSGAAIAFENIRLLGTGTTEDATGGLYGGTILQDIASLVDGITPGIIETGSDFTIESIERAARDTAEAVVIEAASYYTREWAVWEDGRFDWKSVSLDEAQYLIAVSDTMKIDLQGTVEDTPRTVIVQYQDSSGFTLEASAASTDQRNPFVKQSRTNDEIVQVSFPMTNVTASQLAARIAADHGSYPTANGRVVLPFGKTIQRANGAPCPSHLIRGGENISIRDLPKTDAFAVGRDGETTFHVVGVEADLDAQTVTLEIEGQIRRSDVLLARLAAKTRTLTG